MVATGGRFVWTTINRPYEDPPTSDIGAGPPEKVESRRDVFDLDRGVVGEKSDFACSFTRMRSADVRAGIDERGIGSRWWWPKPHPLRQGPK